MPEVTRLIGGDHSGCGWGPGVSGDGAAESGQDGGAVFAHGRDVPADAAPCLGAAADAVEAGNLELCFDGSQISLRLVVGEADPEIAGEQQHLFVPGAQPGQKVSSLGLPGPVAAWVGRQTAQQSVFPVECTGAATPTGAAASVSRPHVHRQE